MKNCPQPLSRFISRFSALSLFLVLLLAFPVRALSAETWAIYLYLCGSDLETRAGAASIDVNEIMGAKLPNNVKVIFQTGGARKWHSSAASPEHIGRFVYEGGGVYEVEKLPQANMGDEKILTSFLEFCEAKFPADRKVFIFWDHGGGSIGGVANDENFGFDSLSLSEIRSAFEKIYQANPENPPFEIIGFDACLMATLDTANTLHGLSRYMVASQDLEPGNGWEYAGFLNALGKNTSMRGEELGKIICDTFMQGCKDEGTHSSATLSLIDLAKMPALTMTYNALGLEAIQKVMENESFYAKLGRQANNAENYMNSRDSGFTNMVDIGSLVGDLVGDLPEFTELLLNTLDEAVVYQVSGPFRNPSGLSCYYPYDGQSSSFKKMLDSGHITSFLMLNGLQFGFIDGNTARPHLERIYNEISAEVEAGENSGQNTVSSIAAQTSTATEPDTAPITSTAQSSQGADSLGEAAGSIGNMLGSLGSQGSGQTIQGSVQGSTQENIQSAGPNLGNILGQASTAVSSVFGGAAPASIIALAEQASVQSFASLAPLQQLDISGLEDFPVTISDNGEAVLSLGADRIQYIDNVNFYLALYSIEDDVIVMLGKEADIVSDWDTGTFKDNFRGVWPSLNGNLVYMEVTNTSDDYNHYIVPVLLNGERHNLIVVYDFAKEKYEILGARRVLDDNMADKAMVQLKEGDKITTLFKIMSISGDDDEFIDLEYEEFILGKDIVFEDMELNDSTFIFMFEMSDVQNNTALSETVAIEIRDGEIILSEVE